MADFQLVNENGSIVAKDPETGEPRPVSMGSVNIEELNNTAWVDATEGHSVVQQAVDDAAANGFNKLYVYGETADWSNTVYLPSDFTIEFLNVSIVPTTDNFDTVDGDGEPFKTVLTNKGNDDESGDSDITIKGDLYVDLDNVALNSDANSWAGVWLDRCSDSEIEGATVENVAPDPDDVQLRQYGILMSHCTDSEIANCVGNNCGYEGVGARGDCDNVEMNRCEGYENRTHSMQAAGFAPAGTGEPSNITFNECKGDSTIIVHADNCKQVDIIDCEASDIVIYDGIEQVNIHGGRVRWIQLSASESHTLRWVDIDDVQGYQGDGSGAGIRFETHSADATIRDVTVNMHLAWGSHLARFELSEGSTVEYIDFIECQGNSGLGGSFLWNDGNNATVHNVRVHGGTAKECDYLVEGDFDGVRLRDISRRNVGSIDDGTPTDLTTRGIDDW